MRYRLHGELVTRTRFQTPVTYVSVGERCTPFSAARNEAKRLPVIRWMLRHEESSEASTEVVGSGFSANQQRSASFSADGDAELDVASEAERLALALDLEREAGSAYGGVGGGEAEERAGEGEADDLALLI